MLPSQAHAYACKYTKENYRRARNACTMPPSHISLLGRIDELTSQLVVLSCCLVPGRYFQEQYIEERLLKKYKTMPYATHLFSLLAS